MEHRDQRQQSEIEGVLYALAAIRAELVADRTTALRRVRDVHPRYRDSSRNLLHYLALRRHDLRDLQARLANLGLSSLGRSEAHVLATVDAVLDVLRALAPDAAVPAPTASDHVTFAEGSRLLKEHTDALLGPAPAERAVRVMVTMPSEASDDYTLIHDLLKQGMNCMRINCAHDSPTAWARMISHLRRAEQSLGLSCRVVMDLAGPKLRTGPLQAGPAVIRIRPERDAYGRVTAPARVWLTSDPGRYPAVTPADAVLPVDSAWLANIKVGERARLTDASGARRVMRVVDVSDRGVWAEARKTTRVIQGTVLKRVDSADGETPTTPVGPLPPIAGFISVQQGDVLIVTRDRTPGHAAVGDSAGRILTPASIGCTIPEVFDDVQPGESIWFDDGKIGGVISRVDEHQVLVRITHAPPGGAKLRADKGINLPDSRLRLAALTSKDLEDLAFVSANADVVALSFANSAEDVASLQHHLSREGGRMPDLVLKIETRRGFENLPDMLLTAMRVPSCGVMIARGDLAIECGFERLAEVQEEILWICEAAHVPVIWATQVLETLAKQGMPSRAEITDAAMGHRAECVMLNKGPHVLTAVRVLDDILRRMQTHQAKKQSMLRELRLAHTLAPDGEAHDAKGVER